MTTTTMRQREDERRSEFREMEESNRRLQEETTARARTVTDSAMNEGRALNEAEIIELRVLREAIEKHSKNAESCRFRREEIESRILLQTDPMYVRTGKLLDSGVGHGFGPRNADNEPGESLTRTDSFVDWEVAQERNHDRNNEPFDLGRAVRGLVTGTWDNADNERRSMSEGVLGQGGYTIPTMVSADIIDRARNAARVVELGAVTIPMENATYRLPRLDGDPVATWRNELAPINDSTPVLSAVDLTARSLGCMVRLSIELLEDTPSLGAFLSAAIGAAMGVEIDRAALRGSGTAPEPRGVRNTAGINTITAGGANGATFGYGPIRAAIAACRAANFEPTGAIWSARTSMSADGLVDTTNQPLNPSPIVASIPRLWSNQIPDNLTQGTSTDCSEAYVADWTKLVLAIRSGLTLRVLDQRYADTGEVALLATMRADIGLTRPAAFSVVTGIRP